jgi:hypothetical protein
VIVLEEGLLVFSSLQRRYTRYAPGFGNLARETRRTRILDRAFIKWFASAR